MMFHATHLFRRDAANALRSNHVHEARCKNFVKACDEHDCQSQYEVLIQALHVRFKVFLYAYHPRFTLDLPLLLLPNEVQLIVR